MPILQYESIASQLSKAASKVPGANPTQQYVSPFNWDEDSWSDGTFGSDWEIDPDLETDKYGNIQPSAAVQANIRQIDVMMANLTASRTTQTVADSYDSGAGWDTEPCEIPAGAAGLESWDSEQGEEEEPAFTNDKAGRWDRAEMLLMKVKREWSGLGYAFTAVHARGDHSFKVVRHSCNYIFVLQSFGQSCVSMQPLSCYTLVLLLPSRFTSNNACPALLVSCSPVCSTATRESLLSKSPASLSSLHATYTPRQRSL
jgi:hypothetical protein